VRVYVLEQANLIKTLIEKLLIVLDNFDTHLPVFNNLSFYMQTWWFVIMSLQRTALLNAAEPRYSSI
jgi:hypothetical protein